MLVEPLRGRPRGDRPLGIFRHGLGRARLGRTLQRRHRRGLRHRRSDALGDRRRARAGRCSAGLPPPRGGRGRPRRDAAAATRAASAEPRLLDRLGLAGADLVLRRDRQLLDARHARRAHRRTLGLRRNERLLGFGRRRGRFCRRSRPARGTATASARSAGSSRPRSPRPALGRRRELGAGAGAGASAAWATARARCSALRDRACAGVRCAPPCAACSRAASASARRDAKPPRPPAGRAPGAATATQARRLRACWPAGAPTARRRCRSRRPTRARCRRGFRRRSRRR